MKVIYTLIFVLLAGAAYGQSSLPACKGDDAFRWSNCTGTKTNLDGRKYVGEWKDGMENGQGTYTFADGQKYVGEFKNSRWHGLGTYTDRNGAKYVGEFKNGRWHGQGIYYLANGLIQLSGIFKDGALVTSQYIDPNSFTRIALGDASKNISDNRQSDNLITLDVAKLKCEELGFKPETEGFGKCVLQLTK